MPIIKLQLVRAESVQDIRDIPHKVRLGLEVILTPGDKRYVYWPSRTDDDDGDEVLKPTDTACACCNGSGRWIKEDLGTGGGGGGEVDLSTVVLRDGTHSFTDDESMGGNKLTDLGAPTNANDAARKAEVTAEAAARAAADSTLSTAITAEASARAAADALLTPKSRLLTGTAPIRIDGGASADLSADRTISVNDADGSNKGIVKLANDLGGTAAAPKVVAITETGGPTQLVIGAIADGKLAKRSGGTLVGHTIGDMAGQEATGAADATAPDSLATLGQVTDLIDGITGATPLSLQYRRTIKRSDFLVDTLAAQDFGGTGVSVTITIDEAQDVTIHFGGSIFRDSGAAIWKGKMGVRVTSSDPVTDETYVMPKENWHSGAGDDTINAVGMAGHFTRQGLDPGTYTIELYWGRTDSDTHDFTLLGESDGYEAGLTVEYTNLETAIGYTSNRSARLYNFERLF